MFTDVAGYTALGQRNESLSLALVEQQRKLIRLVLDKHNGREVKTMGDAFLVEFSSALDAVRCAYDIQRVTRDFNISSSEERRIRLRIGIHLGDVVESQGDISGDAVNVASRIEPLAEEGGVCLTRQVYDQVLNKFELALESLGPKSLKSVSVPIDVYKVVMPWEAERAVLPAELDKKRVAVLPFANMSPDPNDEYFADGLTEEIITSLSGVKELTVIARTSVMKYRASPKGVSDIGRELKVAALIEGSVRKAGNRVRITAQLIDARTEGHIWAQNYDKQLDDIFDVQSEIAERVAKELRVQLIDSEKRRLQKKPTTSTEAYTLYLKGRYQLNKRSKESIERALEYFKLALDSDPEYALAYVGISDWYSLYSSFGYIEPTVAHDRAKEAAIKAIDLDDALGEAHLSLAFSTMTDWDWARSGHEYTRALELNPSDPTAHRWHAHFLFFQKRYQQAMDELDLALQLDPQSALVSLNIAEGLFIMKEYDRAIQQYLKTLATEPDHVPTLLSFVFAAADRGMFEDALRAQSRLTQLKFPESRTNIFLAYILALQGRGDEARTFMNRLTVRPPAEYVPPEELAAVHVALGDKQAAFELLTKAIDGHSDGVVALKYSPRFDLLRSDGRFSLLLSKMNLL